MFAKVIKSILHLNDKTLIQQLCYQLLGESLSQFEKNIINAILTGLKSSVIVTFSNLVEEFPQLSEGINAEVLSEQDIRGAIALYVASKANKKVSRDLMNIAADIAEQGYTDEIQKKLSNVVSSAVSVTEDEYEDPLEMAEEIYKAKKEQGSGLAFGVEAVDKAIGGIQPGSFNTIFAFTGGFKTMSAVNIAYNNTFKKDFNVCYVSLEVIKSDLMWNIYSRHSFEMHSPKFPYLPHDKMRNAQLTDKEEAFLYNDIIPDYKKNRKGHLYLLDESDFDVLSFLGFEKRLREIEDRAIKETGKGIDALIIDQAQLLKFGAKDSGIGQEGSVINAWVSFFRQQCLNFLGTGRPIAVIMLSQSNREGWKRAAKNEGRYDLRAISEANELERASWRIFSIFTDENMKESKEAKVQCLKNRTGRTIMDPIVVFVDPVCYTFGDVGEGFNDSISLDSIDDLFSSEFDTDSLFS